jgi:hypothetical protein
MSKCTCTNPCTCYFEYDGDRPNSNYTRPYKGGRYNTRKKGSGTAIDPYVIEFLDSEEFQVEAGQIRFPIDYSVTSGSNYNNVPNVGLPDYETPIEMFLGVDIPAHATAGIMYVSAHKFWFVSAEATFISNASANGTRAVNIWWIPPASQYGPYAGILGGMIVAGTSSSGVPGAEDITLTCSGFVPFIDSTDTPFFYGPGGSFQIEVQQSSGSAMVVRGVRFNIIAI